MHHSLRLGLAVEPILIIGHVSQSFLLSADWGCALCLSAAHALAEGFGALTDIHSQAVTFLAPEEPGLTRVKVTVRQRDTVCVEEALVTVTNELLAQINPTTMPARGLPGYTFERAPGETWRSKLDRKRNLIVVNNGHRDFVYASRTKSLKLRYLVRLYAKELVMHNFAGLPADHLLERMVELSLRTEEHL